MVNKDSPIPSKVDCLCGDTWRFIKVLERDNEYVNEIIQNKF